MSNTNDDVAARQFANRSWQAIFNKPNLFEPDKWDKAGATSSFVDEVAKLSSTMADSSAER